MSSPSFEVAPFTSTIWQLSEVSPEASAIIGPFETTGYVRDNRFFFGADLARPEDATPWLGRISWQPDPPQVEGTYWHQSVHPSDGLTVLDIDGMGLLTTNTPEIRGIHFVSNPEVGVLEVGTPVYDASGWGFMPVQIDDEHAHLMRRIADAMDEFVDNHAFPNL